MIPLSASARLSFYISTTALALKRRKTSDLPRFVEPYRQRFFGDPLHICFGCSHTNSRGLKLDFFRTEPRGLAFKWVPQENLESFPNIVHGGVSGALLDEICGVVIQADLDLFALTVSSRVNYHAPVYKDRPVIGHARIVKRMKRYVLVEGVLLDERGKVLCSTTALYFIPSQPAFYRITKMTNLSPAMASYVDTTDK